MTRATNADARYRRWIGSTAPRVPAELVIPWIHQAVEKHGSLKAAAEAIGIDVERLRKTRNGHQNAVSHVSAELIAVDIGRSEELAVASPLAGVDDWSSEGRNCGDGTGFDGCGTWFHQHHKEGLCEECFYREVLGFSEIVPRDVRVSREVVR